MSLQVAAVEPHVFVPEEERPAARKETFRQLVSRLSHQSVVKHFDAYADIAWDAEEFRIDPLDPRWELAADDVLGGSAWYRAQPLAVRARLGLHLVAHFMKIGLQFEGVLKRGLLAFAASLPNRSPEFRYVYHEIIEEARHLCFARHYLKEHVPHLERARRAALAVGAPVVLSVMAQLMMRPSPAIIRAYRIPRQVIDEVYVRNPRHRADTLEALDKVRTLASELGLITPRTRRLWQALGIWAGHPSS